MTNITTHALTVESLRDSCLPKAFWGFQADTYVSSQKALQDCLRYLRKFAEARQHGLGLFIRGPEETQKTFLASYVLRVLMTKKVKCLYQSMPELVDRTLQHNLSMPDLLRGVDFLVLDNVNLPGSASFWPSMLNRVLVFCRDNGIPLVVVTQLGKRGSTDFFAQHYGEGNLRLIEHLAYTVWAECDESRKQQMEQKRKAVMLEE